jgi:hypothetical protein
MALNASAMQPEKKHTTPGHQRAMHALEQNRNQMPLTWQAGKKS